MVYPKAQTNQEPAQHASVETNSTHLNDQIAVGFFASLSDAEYAMTGLKSVGFSLSQVTLVAHDFRRQDQFAGVNLCDRIDTCGLEISSEQMGVYQKRLDRGEYMVIVQGTENDLKCAASIFDHRRIQEWQMY